MGMVVKKDLVKLDTTIQQQIATTLDKYISGEEVDVLKLTGTSNRFRIRSDDYRIIIAREKEDTIVIYALRVLNR